MFGNERLYTKSKKKSSSDLKLNKHVWFGWNFNMISINSISLILWLSPDIKTVFAAVTFTMEVFHFVKPLNCGGQKGMKYGLKGLLCCQTRAKRWFGLFSWNWITPTMTKDIVEISGIFSHTASHKEKLINLFERERQPRKTCLNKWNRVEKKSYSSAV